MLSDIKLSPVESRVLGVLVEQSLQLPATTPITAGDLLAACNRGSAPPLDASAVGRALHRLERLQLAEPAGGAAAGPPPGYRPCLARRLQLNAAQTVVLALLLRHGPLTAAELAERGNALFPFADADQVQGVLDSLRRHHQGSWLQVLPTRNGQPPRFLHGFHAPAEAADGGSAGAAAGDPLLARVEELARLIDRLLPGDEPPAA